MKVKVEHTDSGENIFGGINVFIHEMTKLGIDKLIDSHLGKRVKQAKYSTGEIIMYWIYGMLCGANKFDKITKIHKNFQNIPYLKDKIPSRDTIRRMMQKLAIPNSVKENLTNDEVSEVNDNVKLNTLLHKIQKKLNIFNSKKKHTLDVDTIVIPTNAYDSKFSFKKKIRGYHPCVSIIDGKAVYMEMRNGNVSPKYKLLEHIDNTLTHIKQTGLGKIDKLRMDNAGYNNEVFKYLNQKNIKFYVRARKSRDLIDMVRINSMGKWRETEIETTDKVTPIIVSSINYRLLRYSDQEEQYRVVTCRFQDDEIDNFVGRMIITNDFESTEEEIIHFYNQRGKQERVFDDLRNNYGWKYPPFSDMSQNTVFFIVSMICQTVYKYVLGVVTSKTETDKVNENTWLDDFRYWFILVGSVWIITDEICKIVFRDSYFNYKVFFD
ncbi:MAG: IS1380 family transposase [Flavobacteriales bacterium]|nr:IS1380 family transposase [Flavobacteriales bacterium]